MTCLLYTSIQKICPLHGPILQENLAYYIGKYQVWSSYEAEDDGVFVAYASIHGNTAKAAKKLGEVLSLIHISIEHKEVFGITFEQGRNELNIDKDFFSNIVTENKDLPESARIDMAISMITLKYTQSNSVCFVKGGQAIGIGAGQQSRIHCTRLAGQKADNWLLRQSPQVLSLPFKEGMKRAERDNAIDNYIGEDYMDVLADGCWEKYFTEKPPVFTKEEKQKWLSEYAKDVTLGSDAFFPFDDNIESCLLYTSRCV